jgi:hypothetical protein
MWRLDLHTGLVWTTVGYYDSRREAGNRRRYHNSLGATTRIVRLP